VNNGTSDKSTFSLSLNASRFTCSNLGPNTVVLRATDIGGNTSTCTAVVTVRDLSGPVASCKNPTVFLDATGNATLSAAQVDNGSSDACGIASMTISKSAFNCSEISGVQPVILTLTDANGNTSSCLSYVTVKDAIAPTAICEDIAVELKSNGRATVYSEDLALESFDNCSVWSYSPLAKVYTVANLGFNNLTITVKDWSGNASTCISVVQVLPFNPLVGDGGDRNEVQTPAEPWQDGMKEAANLSLFPNPTAGEANIQFELPVIQPFVIQILDMEGRMVLSHEGLGMEGENIYALRSEHFVPGVYVVYFQSGDLKSQKRLVIQK